MTPENQPRSCACLEPATAPSAVTGSLHENHKNPDAEEKFDATILVVEDDLANQDVAQFMLEILGCRVDLAGNGAEAVEKAKNILYDLIFMDCQMPQMDGYEAARLIRKQEENTEYGMRRHVTIIALTGYAVAGDRDQCLASGMDDYLGKPFNIKDLRCILERWLSGKKTGVTVPEKENSAMPVTSPLDHNLLHNIRCLQREGAPNILGKVIDHYCEAAPQSIRRLHEGIAAGDAGVIRSIAHGLKSSSANLGALRLADICREMEALGRDNTLARTGELLKEIEEEYAVVQVALAEIDQGDTL
jgi:two-component system, sensor histidine kinase and response regulator